MTSMRWFYGAALLTVAAAAGAQQARPDFTGEWVAAEDRAPSVAATGDAAFRRGDMGSGWGTTLTIAQRADSMIVSYTFFSAYDLQPPVRLAFRMDGAEARQTVMIGHAGSDQRSTVAWQGNALVITTRYRVPGPANQETFADVRRTLTLESPTTLVLETTRVGTMGGATTSIRTTYTKK